MRCGPITTRFRRSISPISLPFQPVPALAARVCGLRSPTARHTQARRAHHGWRTRSWSRNERLYPEKTDNKCPRPRKHARNVPLQPPAVRSRALRSVEFVANPVDLARNRASGRSIARSVVKNFMIPQPSNDTDADHAPASDLKSDRGVRVRAHPPTTPSHRSQQRTLRARKQRTEADCARANNRLWQPLPPTDPLHAARSPSTMEAGWAAARGPS